MEGIERKRKEPPRAARYHGLVNQGATCYLNSVLQVLFMTKDFREAVKRSSVNCDKTKIDPLLESLFKTLEKSTAETSRITEKLGIKVNEQRDAAEYFEKILRHTSHEASQIFQGELTHTNTCTICKRATNTSDSFWNLPLTLESNKKDYNVEKGIKDLFKQLHIGGENQMYCEGCDAKADAKIIMKMARHPKVLTLLLKRFKFDYQNQEYVKIKQAVTVPHTLQIPKNQTYELYAFVEHFGELRSGHYIVRIKSQDDDRWYKFNDSSVTPFRCQQDKSSSAYLLFYRKKKNEGEEVTDIDHNHVDKQENDEKRKMNDKEDEKGETGSDKQVKKRKKCSTKSRKNEDVEHGDDKSVDPITQKRKADIQESEQGIGEKSKSSGCPKQMKQDAHNYHKNDAKDQQDEMLDSQSRDETDRSNTAGGNREIVMHNDPYSMCSVDVAEVEQNLNDKGQKKEEKKGKKDGEQAQRREETKIHCGQSTEDKDSRYPCLDDDSQNRLQQNKERQIIKDEKGGENTRGKREQSLSGSKGLMKNQRRSTGSEQMKPCDPSEQEVSQSDNKPCSVEHRMEGISSVNEPQTINIKTKTQETAGEVNGEKILTLHHQNLNVSPSQGPQEHSSKIDTGRIGNSHKKNSSTKKNAKKVAKESEKIQLDGKKKGVSDKKRKKKKQKKMLSCMSCVSSNTVSSDSESK